MPEVSQVHIDVALTNVSVEYRNAAFVAEQIAPPVSVKKQSGKYFVYDPEREAFRQTDDKRAPGAEANEVGFALSTDSYYAEDHALEAAIPDEERRGSAIPGLVNAYVFGDFLSGRIWGLRQNSSGTWERTELAATAKLISSFGRDENGELYVVDYAGAVWKLVAQ